MNSITLLRGSAGCFWRVRLSCGARVASFRLNGQSRESPTPRPSAAAPLLPGLAPPGRTPTPVPYRVFAAMPCFAVRNSAFSSSTRSWIRTACSALCGHPLQNRSSHEGNTRRRRALSSILLTAWRDLSLPAHAELLRVDGFLAA